MKFKIGNCIGEVLIDRVNSRYSPNPPRGYEKITAEMYFNNKWQKLSPRHTGELINPKANNLLTLWNNLRVWEGDVDKNGNPTAEYLAKRNERLKIGDYWNQTRKNPLYYYWEGRKLNRSEAVREVLYS
ncbi:MAG: hypothetical protein D8M58_21335 [Calditrichaeota bacterium]|nr:MAG: hypothetical protein DWQ03_00060 [Calditrichota bacterium]MBL1207957.1 hypothetical protein [Calditrichota bacterium]NOG47794.1 hypothetical protein [Calditrichota bacterium]